MKPLNFLPVIGIVLFLYIIWSTGLDKIAESFRSINFFYLSLGILCGLVVFLFRGIKWKMVIKMHGFDEKISQCCKAGSIGMFIGMLTPGRVGDLVRAFYLDKTVPFGKRISTVIIDRVVDLVVVVVSAVIGVILLNIWFGYTIVSFWLTTIIIVGFCITLFLLTRKKFMRRLFRPIFNFFVPNKHKEKLKVDFNEFYDSIGKLRQKKQELFYIIFFNAFIWLFSIVDVSFLGMAIGISFNYLFLFAVISVMVIIELIPISISGIGTREAFLLIVLPIMGLSEGTIIGFSLLYLTLGYWWLALVGLFFWIRNPLKIEI